MPLTAKYCSRCAAPLTTRVVEDRSREVCPNCGTVFYRNPLPVAASVVLNEDREVLLVKRKRDPHKGMWCLPIGFAEMNETIAQAAQRELKEETGVEGQVLRLIDADSFDSDHYGDLLIVSFEMQKVGGTELAGDDAEAVSYFPLNWLPKLAFSSNDKALKACAAAYEEQWAIEDSFNRLHTDQGEELLSDALMTMIHDHAEEISRLWLADVRSSPTTASYREIDADQLFDRACWALKQFGRWIKGDEADQEVRDFYRSVGQQRRAEGVPLHEILSLLTLLRKHVWTYARAQGVWKKPIDLYRVLELNRRIALFFDKAMYYTAVGYEEDRNE